MGNLGGWEWVIILVIVVVLFGVGRISKIAGEMGGGIRAFKKGLQGDEKDKDSTKQENTIESPDSEK